MPDVYPTGDLHLIASLEPLAGMLPIGWSESYTHLAVQRYWVDLQIPVHETTRRERACITGSSPTKAQIAVTSRNESRPLIEET